ncbi:MAG TPA: HPF/RaiA family ribosome-associated protein [Gemmatimonadales bacterium]|nr:HPF/RaiA family ribosome-associated protein [Gemmatimonadales bacterium]
MELPLQITARNVILSAAEEEAIRDAAAKLDEFAARVLSCRVTVEVPRQRGRTGRRFRVHVRLEVPGEEIVVRRPSDEALISAVQQAFKAAGRKLQDHVRRQRGDVKLPRRAPRAVVTRLFPWEGYGFLTAEDGREIYFDRRSVLNDAFGRLEEGAEVRYVEEAGDHGPQASTVAVAVRAPAR